MRCQILTGLQIIGSYGTFLDFSLLQIKYIAMVTKQRGGCDGSLSGWKDEPGTKEKTRAPVWFICPVINGGVNDKK